MEYLGHRLREKKTVKKKNKRTKNPVSIRKWWDSVLATDRTERRRGI